MALFYCDTHKWCSRCGLSVCTDSTVQTPFEIQKLHRRASHVAQRFTKWRVPDTLVKTTAVLFTRTSRRCLPEFGSSGEVSRNYYWLETRPEQHSEEVSGRDVRYLLPSSDTIATSPPSSDSYLMYATDIWPRHQYSGEAWDCRHIRNAESFSDGTKQMLKERW